MTSTRFELTESFDGPQDDQPNSPHWTYVNDVKEESGYLAVRQSATDVPTYGSLAFDTPILNPEVDFSARYHAGNSYFHGGASFRLKSADGETITIRFKMLKSSWADDYDRNPDNFDKPKINVIYPDGQFDTLYSAGNASSSYFDTWTDFAFDLDSGTGRLTLDVEADGTPEFVYTDARLKGAGLEQINFGAYGWWTGHYAHYDDIAVRGRTGPTTNDRTVEGLAALGKDFIADLHLPFDSPEAAFDEWRVSAGFDHPPEYGGDVHLAQDWNWRAGEADAGKDVVAILDIDAAKFFSGIAGGTLVAHHTLPGGEKITAVYMHVSKDIGAGRVFTDVKAGEKVGEVQPKAVSGYPAHLHFALMEGHVAFEHATYGVLNVGGSHTTGVGSLGITGITRLQRPNAPANDDPENGTLNLRNVVNIDPLEFFARHSADFQVFLRDRDPSQPGDGDVRAIDPGETIKATIKPALYQVERAGAPYPELRTQDTDIFALKLDKNERVAVSVDGVAVGGLDALPLIAATIRKRSDFDTRLKFAPSDPDDPATARSLLEGKSLDAEFVAPSAGTYFLRVGWGNSGDYGGYKLAVKALPQLTFDGKAGADSIAGNAADNTMKGFGGNDRLLARAGDDTLLGGAGRDTLKGGTGKDALSGGTGRDTLFGQGGNDRLNGGKGNDRLNGGKGADDFVFAAKGGAHADRVLDFARVADDILLQDAVFTALSGRADGQLTAGEFRLGGVARDGNDHVLYQKSTGKLWYDPDGAGGKGKVLIAEFDAGTALLAGDVFLI